MIKQIEKAEIVGHSWGEKNLILVKNLESGEVKNFICNQELELGTEGVLEYNDNLVISFVAVNEEVMA